MGIEMLDRTKASQATDSLLASLLGITKDEMAVKLFSQLREAESVLHDLLQDTTMLDSQRRVIRRYFDKPEREQLVKKANGKEVFSQTVSK
jgi:hypothetical protein